MSNDYTGLPSNEQAAESIREAAKKEAADPNSQVGKSGQSRIAHRFAREAIGKHLHVHGVGWLFWDKHRWAEDLGNKRARQALRRTLTRAWSEALDDKELAKDVRLCQSANGEKGALDIASTIPTLSADLDDLDADPNLLNTMSGTVDLTNGTLLPHDPANRITKVTRAAYDPAALSPNWDKFLSTSLPDTQVREFLQRYVGQALRGRNKEQRLAILTGAGSNGKSVWTEAVGFALGDYSFTGRPEMLMASRDTGFDGSENLRGVRWATFSEIERGQELGVAMVKRLTGTETIRARVKHKADIEFSPSHSLAMIVNDLPEIKDAGHGIWRRVAVIPWEVIIREDQQDRDLGQKLEAEAEAVLAWCIRGLVEYQRIGLADPDAVQLATKTYQAKSDQLVRFLDQCTIRGGAMGPPTTTQLYAVYQEWARMDPSSGMWSAREFRDEMATRSPALQLSQNRTRAWKEICIRPNWKDQLLSQE